VKNDLPEFVTAYRDRHGKERLRFRRTGFPVHSFQHPAGSDEFWQKYLELKNAQRPSAQAKGNAPGSLDDLIARYYKSVQWKNIPKDTTRRVYRGELERFRALYGGRPAATMSARAVNVIMERMHETPSAAANLLKRLRQLFDYAILQGIRKDNPAKPVRAPKTRSTGFHTWSEDEIAAFEKKWKLGTREYLALSLLLYTAQRRSDIVTMGPQHVKDGRIRVRQMKTDKVLFIPMHSKLEQAIKACPSGQLAFLVTEKGTPFVKESFTNWFRKRCDMAGLAGCSAHGLRKAAARRMAETGLSNQLIKSITGHSSDSEVARYTRDAEQMAMADKAMDAMNLANPISPDLANPTQISENKR